MRPFAILVVALLCACGGNGGSSPAATTTPPPAPASADITALFMGNSHTAVNNLPGMVAEMVRMARPGKTVMQVEAPNWMFLDERAGDGASLALLRSRNWTYVVLQAQKYSTSGLFYYPIDGAVSLVGMARTQKALPILFPEWSRKDVAETQRIFDLHVSIAQQAPACIAPIPQAWDLALARYPTLTLHDADGNHAVAAGSFLAALVIANTMTAMPPDQLAFIPGFGVDAETQAKLRGIAAETVLAYRARQWCPGDPVTP